MEARRKPAGVGGLQGERCKHNKKFCVHTRTSTMLGNYFLILILCYTCVCVCNILWKSEDGVGSRGTVVRSGCSALLTTEPSIYLLLGNSFTSFFPCYLQGPCLDSFLCYFFHTGLLLTIFCSKFKLVFIPSCLRTVLYF